MPRPIWLALTFLVCLSLACSFSYSIGATPTPTPAPTPAATASPSSMIASVTLAKGVSGDQSDPVNPTKTFAPTEVIHAVVAIKAAPDNTKVTASFYVVNVGNAAKAGLLIDSADLTASGTRNLDFSLTPNSPLPVGTYKVVISVDDKKEKTVDFSVK